MALIAPVAASKASVKMQAVVECTYHEFENGNKTFIVQPIGNGDFKKQLLNKGQRTLSALFERDASGDHVLINALAFLKANYPEAYKRAKLGIPSLIEQLKKA